jgi:hypothetical protein
LGASKKQSSKSKAETLEQVGEFWDDHDFTDYDTDVPEVDFKVVCAVPVDIELFTQVEQQAQLRGVSVETLVNIWLQQKLIEHRSM